MFEYSLFNVRVCVCVTSLNVMVNEYLLETKGKNVRILTNSTGNSDSSIVQY